MMGRRDGVSKRYQSAVMQRGERWLNIIKEEAMSETYPSLTRPSIYAFDSHHLDVISSRREIPSHRMLGRSRDDARCRWNYTIDIPHSPNTLDALDTIHLRGRQQSILVVL
jgi:hypothetical protein